MKKTKLLLLKKQLLLFLSIVLFSSTIAYAQGNVTGKISDNSGTPITGATIIETGTQNGVVSDFDGNFSITLLKSPSELTISFLGYATQTTSVSTGDNINIVLAEDLAQLDEVVVIGYGTTKRTNLTMAVSSVNSKAFEDQPLFRTEDALQSRAAGVSVTKSTGAPGGNLKIRIRGSNSVTQNNGPLLVIDGIIGGDLSAVNPNDIASMDILKDASASAVYGARGANGVILITTKKGRGKAKIDVNYFTSVSSVPKRLPIITPEQYATIHGTGPVIDGGVDYQDEYFTTGITNNLQLTASGQEGNLSYYLSGNYVNQSGIVINTDYERYSLRSNIETKIGDKLKLGLNLFATKENNHNLEAGGRKSGSDNRGGILSALIWNPTYPVRMPDGTYYNLDDEGRLNPDTFGSVTNNPIATQLEKNDRGINDRLTANLNLSYEFNSNFNYKLIAGSTTSNINNYNYARFLEGSVPAYPRSDFNSRNLVNYQLSNIFTYQKDFGNVNLKLTGVYENAKTVVKRTGGNSLDYTLPAPYQNDGFFLLNLGAVQSVNAAQTIETAQSYVARAEVTVANNLNVTGILRIDESSKFRKGNRTGYFPSGSASYNFSDLLSEDGFVNSLKLRGGYGEVGNNGINPYDTFGGFGGGNGALYAFGSGTLFNGLQFGGLIDPNLTWETTKQFNAGVDFAVFDEKVNVSIDWYKKNTEDLILQKPVEYSNGDPDGVFITNVGETKNTGIDVTIDANIIDKGDFYWNSNFVLSVLSNEVVSLGEDERIFIQPDDLRPGGGQINTHVVEVGEPLGQMWGAFFLGTYKTGNPEGATPGSTKYLLDENGDIVFGVVGNGLPKVTAGLNNTLTYKNFELNLVFNGAFGFDVYNATYAEMVGTGKNPNHKDFLNRWTAANETEIPSVADNLLSDRYIEKGDFVRLSNISLGYNFKDLKYFSSLKVYASAQNLFTISGYRGFDPEVSSTSNGTDVGPSLDYGAFPNPRTFTFGINIGL